MLAFYCVDDTDAIATLSWGTMEATVLAGLVQ